MLSRPRRAFRLFLWVLRLTARRFLRHGQRPDLLRQQMLLRAARASANRAGADRDSGGRADWVRLGGWRRRPFASAAFDVVVAACVLEYVAELAAVPRSAQVLRPGGVVLYTVPDLRDPVRWAEWWAQRLARLTGGLPAAGRRQSRWNGYHAYLRASLQRHGVRWRRRLLGWPACAQCHARRTAPCPRSGCLRLAALTNHSLTKRVYGSDRRSDRGRGRGADGRRRSAPR